MKHKIQHEQKAYTIREVAERFSVSADVVAAWLRNGSLIGIDVSAKRGGRPSWRITSEAIQAFEVARSTSAPVKPQRRRAEKMPAGFVEYF